MLFLCEDKISLTCHHSIPSGKSVPSGMTCFSLALAWSDVNASSSGCLMVADLDIMEKPPRSPTEGLVSPWTFVRWMVVGFYVGFATVAAFAFWYMFDNVLGVDLSQDGHSTVTWYQLTHYTQCSQWKGFQVSICSVHHTHGQIAQHTLHHPVQRALYTLWLHATAVVVSTMHVRHVKQPVSSFESAAILG